MKNTEYKDINGVEISEGDTVKIACNPYHGEYVVKFGEYSMRPFTTHDRKHRHLGFYLDNGENIISFLHAMEQQKGYGASTHRVEKK